MISVTSDGWVEQRVSGSCKERDATSPSAAAMTVRQGAMQARDRRSSSSLGQPKGKSSLGSRALSLLSELNQNLAINLHASPRVLLSVS